MILATPIVDAELLAKRTGWTIKAEGACRGEVCVPLGPSGVREDGTVDVRLLAEHLGMPLIHDEAAGLWCLGPETAVTGKALTSAVAPELELPDLRTGEMFSLSSLRGRKVLLVAWASW